jgi:hypothetical protein
MNIKALALAVLVVFGPAGLLIWGIFVEIGGLPLTVWLILSVCPIAVIAILVGWTAIAYDEIMDYINK